MIDIAVVSVITTGIVGLAAALTPAVIRYTDRKYERYSKKEDNIYKRREQYWALRESLYLDLIASCTNGMNLLVRYESSEDGEEPPEVIVGKNIGPRTIAYASDRVGELHESFSRIFAVIAGFAQPSEYELSVAKVSQLNEENGTAAIGRWLDFAKFVYDQLREQIRGELASGQISMQGIGEPVEHDVFREYLAAQESQPGIESDLDDQGAAS